MTLGQTLSIKCPGCRQLVGIDTWESGDDGTTNMEIGQVCHLPMVSG